jgi:hypothetical protein
MMMCKNGSVKMMVMMMWTSAVHRAWFPSCTRTATRSSIVRLLPPEEAKAVNQQVGVICKRVV